MADENTRILKLFYIMANMQGFIKANELACRLQTSERTVKSCMEQLKTFALEKGCRVHSVRGKGYCIQVTDSQIFESYKKRLEILFNNVEKQPKGKQAYAITRAILMGAGADEEGYVRIEELADTLFMSSSSLKKEMGEVREFLESFHLSLVSRPGRGIRLIGKEFNLRLCMLELYENHYKTRVVPFQDEAYERTLEDCGDKDEIRREMLNLIRDSKCEIFDIYINRMIDYFLLLRNRSREIEFEPENDEFGSELSGEGLDKEGEESDLAWKMADGLEQFSGYCLSDQERRGIARLILLWSDRDWQKERMIQRFPLVSKKAEKLLAEIRRELLSQWRLPLEQIDYDFEMEFMPEIVRILIQGHYGFSGCQMIGNSIQENAIKSSPISMTLAGCAAQVIEQSCHIKLNAYNIQLLAVRFFGMIHSVSYDYKPRRVLICGRNGRASGRIIASEISSRLGTWWQGRMDVIPLYEGRKLSQESYDCMIGSYHTYAYNYSWPYVKVSQAVTSAEINEIYRRVVLQGYCLKEAAYEKKWDVVQIHRDFSGYSLESFIQLLAFEWGKDYEAKKQLNERLNYQSGKPYIHMAGQLLYILVPTAFTQKRILELYFLKKPLTWRGGTTRQAVFLSVDFSEAPKLLLFAEDGLRLLTGKMDDEEFWAGDSKLMTENIRQSI